MMCRSRTVGGGPHCPKHTCLFCPIKERFFLRLLLHSSAIPIFAGGLAFTQRKRTATKKEENPSFVLGLAMKKKVAFQFPTSQQDPSGMYPKVKVRTESQRQDRAPASHEHDWNSLLSLKDIQFLSLQDSYFPVRTTRDVSPLTKARIPKCYVPSVSVPSEAIADEVWSAEVEKRTNPDEEDARIRASSIPRPRAVISSPDNDAMIGHKNKTTAIRPAVSNYRTSIPNRHLRCKVMPACTEEESPASTMNSKDVADAKTETKEKKGSVTAATGRRRKTGMRQPSPFRI